jgi:TRAP-type C4-dicarboxylate transport system permease small subunit
MLDKHVSSATLRHMENNHQTSYLERIRLITNRIEDGLLVALLLFMIGLAVAQIFLRNLFQVGFVWGDSLVRLLVLWIGLVGAMIASREGKHIHIDVVTRYLPERVNIYVMSVINLITTLICLSVAWYSFQFVQTEYQSGGEAFAGIPNWACETILPFAFLVMAIRYFILSLISIQKIRKPLT